MAKPKFQDTNDPFLVQGSLFLPPGVQEGTNFYPPILRDHEGIRKILSEARGGIGLDLEFDPKTGKPSILGVSSRELTGAVPWDPQLAREVVEVAEKTDQKIIGHSVLGADRPILENALGIKTPLDMWRCSMLGHYLCQSQLCKSPGKEEDEDAGALGFMGLWTMASLYTDLPQWKICRGKACFGPCPLHDPWGYCAVDSWAGLEGHFNIQEDLKRKQIPEKLYLELHELTEICDLMERRGVRVDTNYVKQMEENFDELKLSLFPTETVNGKLVFKHFNPKSPAQVTEYFKQNGINLKAADKKSIHKALEKEAKNRGFSLESLETAEELPEVLDNLHRLYQYKDSGKGLKSWFDGRYVDKDDLIHARFISTGASTGRLASSRPNLMNVPARGWGAAIRRAIIPRDESLKFLDMDFSQLELRVVLYLAGVDPRDIMKDAFVYLVERSDGRFDKAAELLHMTARDVAKSVSHGADYGEGIKVLYPADFQKSNVKADIEAGALRVYPDWSFRGGIVAFTGANLAERLFGDKSRASRAKALAIQEDVYCASFPMIRKWQQTVTDQIDTRGAIQSPVGRYLPLYGSPEDDAKLAFAFLGQGLGADFVQEKMIRYYREAGVIFPLQIHDSLVAEVPRDWDLDKVRDFYTLMKEESYRLPGFVCPFKVKEGFNWGDTKKLDV